MKIDWTYLTETNVGEHWADQYINFQHIASEQGKGNLVLPDNGLGDMRYQTISGNLRNLLGSSKKIEKTDGSAVLIRVLYLSPARESDIPVSEIFPEKGWSWGSAWKKGKGIPVPKRRLNPNTCWRHGSCAKTCIITAGNMRYNVPSRYCKTWFWYTQPIVFLRLILSEIALYSEEAYLSRQLFYPRLNGTSDLMWERYIDMDSLVSDLSGLGGFYDYTKWEWSTRVEEGKEMGIAWPNYYHITFSVDEKRFSKKWAKKWLEEGYNISMVVSTKSQKKALRSQEMKGIAVNGDKTDFRFMDPPRSIVLLNNKGNLAATEAAMGGSCGSSLSLVRRYAEVEEFADLTRKMNLDTPIQTPPMKKKPFALRPVRRRKRGEPARRRAKKTSQRGKFANPRSKDREAVTEGRIPFYRGGSGSLRKGRPAYFISAKAIAKCYGPVREYHIKLRNPKFVDQRKWAQFDSTSLRFDPSPAEELAAQGYDSVVWAKTSPSGNRVYTVYALNGKSVSLPNF